MGVGKTIGKSLNYGYPGSYAIQPDQLTVTRVSCDANEIPFGTVVIYDDTNVTAVKQPTATFTMDKFAGVAARIVKQPESYTDQNTTGYQQFDAVTVFQRGIIAVDCVYGTPKLNGDVYFIYSAGGTAAKVGFAAQDDAGHAVKLEGVKFVGDADANGITAINLLTKQNV